MKIYNGKDLLINRLYQRQLEDKKKENVCPEEKTASDSLAISSEAARIRESVKTAMELAEVRAEKVEAIKEKLENGTYILDSEKIAESILKNK